MTENVMFDTNVIIDYLRELPAAVTCVESTVSIPTLSNMVIGELDAGVRDGQERLMLDSLVEESIVVPISREIAVQGGLFCRQYRSSHGVSLADSLIAATAIIRNASLITQNIKHFPMLTDVFTPY